mmetsp:Transcript_29029/g.50097  ORF Transcript_29029/g.50097 Transcript_29029/m.50097 type:complete len:94 (-) Transcript_29029:152-433(-)
MKLKWQAVGWRLFVGGRVSTSGRVEKAMPSTGSQSDISDVRRHLSFFYGIYRKRTRSHLGPPFTSLSVLLSRSANVAWVYATMPPIAMAAPLS